MLSKIIDASFIPQIQQKALKTISDDRNQFAVIWKTIEQYCEENDLIISDVNVITNEKDAVSYICNKRYKIYTSNPFRHANNLTNMIHTAMIDDPLRYTTKMRTIKEHEEFSIDYNIREIATIYQLQKHRSIELRTIINPITVDKLLYMPPEIELIDIYHKLYDPSQSHNTDENLMFEKILYDKAMDRKGIIGSGEFVPDVDTSVEKWGGDPLPPGGELDTMWTNPNRGNFYGGDPPPPGGELDTMWTNPNRGNFYGGSQKTNDYLDEFDEKEKEKRYKGSSQNTKQWTGNKVYREPYNTCKEKKKEMLEFLKISIVKDWLPKKKNTILIGSWAYDWMSLGKDLCANIEKIQLISEMNQNELLQELQKYINTIHKATISFREQDLHIPKDFRTCRYTYYMQIKTERGITEKPFLDLFNCASFEIIPYSIVDDISIGSKWVNLRFLFIDLWIIRLIKKLNLMTEDIINKKLAYIWKLIDNYRNTILTDSTDYMGTYRDYIIDKKISNISGKMFMPYFPDMFLRNNNAYRTI
jgi:hypothetical protein